MHIDICSICGEKLDDNMKCKICSFIFGNSPAGFTKCASCGRMFNRISRFDNLIYTIFPMTREEMGAWTTNCPYCRIDFISHCHKPTDEDDERVFYGKKYVVFADIIKAIIEDGTHTINNLATTFDIPKEFSNINLEKE